MKTVILVVNLLALSTIASAAAVDCTLATPTGAIGANVTSLTMGCFGGGLLFDMFAVDSAPPGTNIFVSALGTGPVASPQGFSLGFQILTPTAPVDTMFQYRVSTLNGAASIIGVDNGQNGINTTIGEVVCDQAFVGGICATGHVIANFSNPPTPNNTVVPLIGAQSQIFIMKDIAEPTRESFISSFVNSHETSTVPEPSTSLLLGFGLCGIAGLARKLRKG
jgi:hypothetical protein